MQKKPRGQKRCKLLTFVSLVEIRCNSTESWHVPVFNRLVTELMIVNSNFYQHTIAEQQNSMCWVHHCTESKACQAQTVKNQLSKDGYQSASSTTWKFMPQKLNNTLITISHRTIPIFCNIINASNTATVEFVACYLKVILNSTHKTIEQTQLNKEWTLIHLLQLYIQHSHW